MLRPVAEFISRQEFREYWKRIGRRCQSLACAVLGHGKTRHPLERAAQLKRDVDTWITVNLDAIADLRESERHELRHTASRAWVRLQRHQLTHREQNGELLSLGALVSIPYLIAWGSIASIYGDLENHQFPNLYVTFMGLAAAGFTLYVSTHPFVVISWITILIRRTLGYQATVRRTDRILVELVELTAGAYRARSRRHVPAEGRAWQQQVQVATWNILRGPSNTVRSEPILILEERIGVGHRKQKKLLLRHNTQVAELISEYKHAFVRAESDADYQLVCESLLSGTLAASRGDWKLLLENAKPVSQKARARAALKVLRLRLIPATALTGTAFIAPSLPGIDSKAIGAAQGLLFLSAIIWLVTGDKNAVDTVRAPLEKAVSPSGKG